MSERYFLRRASLNFFLNNDHIIRLLCTFHSECGRFRLIPLLGRLACPPVRVAFIFSAVDLSSEIRPVYTGTRIPHFKDITPNNNRTGTKGGQRMLFSSELYWTIHIAFMFYTFSYTAITMYQLHVLTLFFTIFSRLFDISLSRSLSLWWIILFLTRLSCLPHFVMIINSFIKVPS